MSKVLLSFCHEFDGLQETVSPRFMAVKRNRHHLRAGPLISYKKHTSSGGELLACDLVVARKAESKPGVLYGCSDVTNTYEPWPRLPLNTVEQISFVIVKSYRITISIATFILSS